MDELKKCKFCLGDIPKDREKNAMSKSVIFCSPQCGQASYRRDQKSKIKRPIKRCLWCDKTTNEVKRWCDSYCRTMFVKKNGENYNGQIRKEEFETLHKGFAWDEPEYMFC